MDMNTLLKVEINEIEEDILSTIETLIARLEIMADLEDMPVENWAEVETRK